MTEPFTRGWAEIESGRRTLLKAGGAGLLFSAAAPAADAAGSRRRPRHPGRRAYVVVVDGCRPDEVDEGVTPNLLALREGGLRYPRASSMPVMETIPNHVMMMTGLRPDRTGVPANDIYDRSLGDTRTMDRPEDLKARTIIERMNKRGYRTGTVLSKEYLYGVFGTRATHRWEPAPIVPVSGHAPDQFTMQATLAMIDDFDPHLLFVNLGDIDRMGHSDPTGPLGLRAARRAALADTDELVGQFVDHLKSTGRWRRSIVIVLADHSMDWSKPDRIISLTAPLAADPMLTGRVAIAANGGADLLYWTGPEDQRAAAVSRMRAVAAQVPGVLSTHVTDDPDLRLGPVAGRRRRLLHGRLAVQRPSAGNQQPDPRQPRPPGHAADPVLHRRRAPCGSGRRIAAAARAHRRRGANGRELLRDPGPARWVRRPVAASCPSPLRRVVLVSGPGYPAGAVATRRAATTSHLSPASELLDTSRSSAVPRFATGGVMPRSRKPPAHRWVQDACTRCGLHRREAWLLDDAGHAVMALVWSETAGDVRVQPFPRLLGLDPPSPPTQTREEAFGALPVGTEPPCVPVKTSVKG